MNLWAPTGQPLVAGTYVNAVRFADATHPGLDVYGDGRGCNQVAGSFTVDLATYDQSNAIVAFDATFEQHCEGGVPTLTGEIAWNAPDVPIPTPSPSPVVTFSPAPSPTASPLPDSDADPETLADANANALGDSDSDSAPDANAHAVVRRDRRRSIGNGAQLDQRRHRLGPRDLHPRRDPHRRRHPDADGQTRRSERVVRDAGGLLVERHGSWTATVASTTGKPFGSGTASALVSASGSDPVTGAHLSASSGGTVSLTTTNR